MGLSNELRVLGADDSFVVVDKPAGLLAVPGRGEAGRDNAASRVQALFADARVVHRLDMATSGLLLFARGASAQHRLGEAFAARAVGKRYVAVVHGLLDADDGRIELPLAADWPRRPRQKVDLELGRPATTQWRVVARDPGRARTRLELEPVSGRTHQLRVHLAAIGHPIVGDMLYGSDDAPRLLLHASALDFAHPESGTPLSFTSAPPF